MPKSTASTELSGVLWGIKTLPHILNKWDFPTINRDITFRDTPLKGNILCLIWNLCWASVKHRYHYCVVEAYLLKYTVICRLVRLDEASEGH